MRATPARRGARLRRRRQRGQPRRSSKACSPTSSSRSSPPSAPTPPGRPTTSTPTVSPAAIAEALGAEKLVYLTDIEGLRRDVDDAGEPDPPDDRRRARRADRRRHDRRRDDPQGRGCTHAVRNGVGRAHILDGRIAHVLLLEIFTDEGIGTMVTNPTRRQRESTHCSDERTTMARHRSDARNRSAHVPVHAGVRPARGDVRARQGHRAVGHRRQAATSTSCRASPSSSLGHANPVVAEAIATQAHELLHVSNYFANPTSTAAADGDQPAARRGHRPVGPDVLHQLGRRGRSSAR